MGRERVRMTNLQHLAIAIALQCFVGLVTGNWWAGAALSAGIFAGREHAQAEYRWIEQVGRHFVENEPPELPLGLGGQ